MGDTSERQRRNDPASWESFWQRAGANPEVQVPWNFGSVDRMVPYLDELIEHFDRSLPLIDLGCGDGIVSEHLAEHFEVVLGADVSAAAVAKARNENPGSRVNYEQLDCTDVAAARVLHGRLGDANVHLRGVLHAMAPENWPHALETLATLTGERGRLFDIEISQEFSRVLAEAARHGVLPEQLRSAGSGSELLPNEFTAEGLGELYRERHWRVRSIGELVAPSLMKLTNGEDLHYPFVHVIADRRPPEKGSQPGCVAPGHRS